MNTVEQKRESRERGGSERTYSDSNAQTYPGTKEMNTNRNEHSDW